MAKAGNPCQLWTFADMWAELSVGLTEQIEPSHIGRLAQLLKAVKPTCCPSGRSRIRVRLNTVATSKPENKGIQIGGFNVWWDDGDQIHLQLNEQDSDLPRGALWITFSSNPDSGNYHPVNFNQCAEALRRHNKSAPDPVPEESRELEARGFVRAN